MSDTWRNDVAEVLMALRKAIPALVVEENDYGLTVSVMNPETQRAIKVAIAYRPERDGWAGHRHMVVAGVPDALEYLTAAA